MNRHRCQKDDSTHLLRLHKGMISVQKENTELRKQIKLREKRIAELEKELEKLSVERDELLDSRR